MKEGKKLLKGKIKAFSRAIDRVISTEYGMITLSEYREILMDECKRTKEALRDRKTARRKKL